MIRVVMPHHLRTLASVTGEVTLDADGVRTIGALLDELEAAHPVLRGTIRDQVTLKRRGFVRYFACKEDLSFEAPDAPLPDDVVSGKEPFCIIGAMAGG